MRRVEVEPLISHRRRMQYVHLWTGSRILLATPFGVFRTLFHRPLSKRKGRKDD
jgi:hypothetical protein